MGLDQVGANKRPGALFSCVIDQGIFGSLILLNSFPQEKVIVLRERAAGMYSVSAYYLAKSLAEMVIQLVFPFIFTCCAYWLMGLQAEAGKFFIFMLFMELCCLTAESIALMLSTLCRRVSYAIVILPIIFEGSRLFGGFLLPPKLLPRYFSWLDALSFIKYSYVGIALNELSGLVYYCKPAQLVNGKCLLTSGHQQIDNLGLDFITIWGCALVLFAMIIVFRFVAYCALRWENLWDFLSLDQMKSAWRYRRTRLQDKLEAAEED